MSKDFAIIFENGVPGEAEILELLASAGVREPQDAAGRLRRLANNADLRAALPGLLPYLLPELAASARPAQVLLNLERLAINQPDPAGFFDSLGSDPRALQILAALFSGSQFLSEILMRRPQAVWQLVEMVRAARAKTPADLDDEWNGALLGVTEFAAQMDALRRFQRWELLRIGVCDMLGLFDLPAVTLQLSNLADAVVRACLQMVCAGCDASGFAVFSLGKLGGRELNYSSDIDLLFIASDSEAYGRTAEQLIEALAGVTDEGFLYRVDMRLRPWGRMGALVSSVDGYLTYLQRSARLWEKQALLKARLSAGDAAIGDEFLRRVGDLLYSHSPAAVRAEVSAMKGQTERYLREQGRDWGEIKLGEGSIRDVEFVAQSLQLAHGARQPEIRSRTTLDALARLYRYGLLPLENYRVLADGYTFLRAIEHHLQIMDYRQTYSLPRAPEALAQLSRRLGFLQADAAGHFLARYDQHRAAIRAVYLQYLGDVEMKPSANTNSEVRRHVERMDPAYENIFSQADIHRHAELAGKLDALHLVEMDAAPLQDGYWRVSIVAYDYPGELAAICGLMFVHGMSILEGNVFTYEPADPARQQPNGERRKIVDVFTVLPASEPDAQTWARYHADLAELLTLLQAGQRSAARASLARRVALALNNQPVSATPLYPIEIEIDNQASLRYTVLRITSQDTLGFLYELTSSLSYNNIYIARVEIDTVGKRISDTLYVTDAHGKKIENLRAQRELRAATVLIKHFTHLLPQSPDPAAALLHFRQFIAQLFMRPNWPDELASLERQEVLHALAQVLGVSNFLWDDFLRMQYANLFPVVRDVDALETAKTHAQLQRELEDALRPVHAGAQPPREDAPWREVLNAFKDREMFRIDMRHILEHTAEFWHFAEELTDLAEVVVNSAYHLTAEDLRSVYGVPLLDNGETSQMSVCALGKMGGYELGFASDIELMFIYAGNGSTSGAQLITSSEFHEKVVENFIRAIRARQEGIFEIDLQLRPYGKAGSLAVSLESFQRYFGPGGAAWSYERQALVRLRPVAGDPALGRQIEALRDACVYRNIPFDVTAMRAMRERQVRHLVQGGTFNAKFSPGGLVDLEYLVQGLQITHGHRAAELRSTNTRRALAALAAAGIITDDDYARLRKAHTFLRWLIDGMRVVAGNAKDLTVPRDDSEAFAFLARRLRYGADTARLREELRSYTAYVQEANRRLLGE